MDLNNKNVKKFFDDQIIKINFLIECIRCQFLESKINIISIKNIG